MNYTKVAIVSVALLAVAAASFSVGMRKAEKASVDLEEPVQATYSEKPIEEIFKEIDKIVMIEKLCLEEASLADTVLRARQQGRTLRDTLALAGPIDERTKEIILGAYNFMLGYGPAQRAEMRNIYSDGVQSECLRMWKGAK